MMLSTKTKYFLEKPSFLDNPHGWIPHIPFAFYLVEVLKPRLIVELGTYSGNAYFAFCQAANHLSPETRCFAVDTWKGDIHVGAYGNEVYERVKAINEAHFSEISTLLKMPFDDALSTFADRSIDLLHIDGTHTYEAVSHDFASWLPKLNSRGVVLLHDTRVEREGFGVKRFFDEIKSRYPNVEFPFGEGLAVICTGDDPPQAIIELISVVARDNFLLKIFEVLGNNILLTRERDLFREEVLKMRKLTVELNLQIREKSGEVKKLQKKLQQVRGSRSG